jgi:L-asparaginase II
VPVFYVPLRALALGYARLVGSGAPGETPAEAAARRRVVGAMRTAPEMVAGTGRFTTDVMREFRGTLVAKEGAEGVYAVGIPAALARRRGGEAVGIAIKIADGAERGRDAVTVEVLRQMGFVSGARLARLRRLVLKPVRNVRGDVVGDLHTVFRLVREAA